MTKVFVTLEQVNDNQAVVLGDDAHHLRNVLRKNIGDPLLIGVNSKTFRAEIIEISEDKVVCELMEPVTISAESPLKTTLYQAVAKGDKMDLIIQKAVELGVSEIVPFFSRHTVVKLTKDKQHQRQQRWQKIAESAAKQCKRDLIPTIHVPHSFEEVKSKLAVRTGDHLLLMAYELAEEQTLKDLTALYPQHVSMIIGPEGGFSQDEAEAVQSLGGEIIKLGNRILRTETAAITVLALVQFLWGDLG